VSDCEHKNETISAFMSMPRLGYVDAVRCEDCGQISKTCWWEEMSPLNFEMKFGPPEKPTGNSFSLFIKQNEKL
jgi:hypothetical protein